MSDQIRGGALIDHGDALFDSMSAKLRVYNGDDGMSIEIDESFSICRVPPSTRKVDPSAYEPEVVSIGPYHHQHPNYLHTMEDHKWRYMHNLLRRRRRRGRSNSTDHQSDSADEVLKRCIDKVRRSEARARRCYEVPNFCNISNYDFVMALVLDGCFILELFLMTHGAAADDLIYVIPWMFPAIWRDLLKLENQIPFFILQDLFTAIGVASYSRSFEELAFWYLSKGPLTLDPFKEEDPSSDVYPAWIINMTGGKKIYHLLHFYQMLLQPSTTTSTSNDDDHAAGNINNLQPRYCSSPMSMLFEKTKKINLMAPLVRVRSVDTCRPNNTILIPCVGELCDAGITVSWRKPEKKKKKAACAVQLDVTFKDGVLHVPRLTVDDHTSTVFRNLLALEQFCPGNSLHVTSYTNFLDCIVDTAKDVTILEQHGIISNLLGSEDEVALLINRLGKDVTFSNSHYLEKVFTEVNYYCESKCHKYRASCMRDYFGNPWSAISLLAAAALLLMTLIQVVFAILSYKKQ